MTNLGANLLKITVGWAYQPNNETFVPLFTLTKGDKNLVKIASHSEDNNILSPKNLLKEFQEDLSLNAQDDENVDSTLSQISKFALAH